MAFDDITREIGQQLEVYLPDGGNIIDQSMGEGIAEGSIDVLDDQGIILFRTEDGQQYRLTVEPVL